jgi:RNA recognition motif-containing protein
MLDSLIIPLFYTGRSKGWGIVEFETPEEAVNAINAMNGTDLGGRTILVREDREDRDVKLYNEENGIKPQPASSARGGGRGGGGGRGTRGGRGGRGGRGSEAAAPAGECSGTQVVVHGLPWSYTWKELKPMFEGCGTIVRADVVYGRDGRSRGYGTVQFSSEEEAQAAIEQYNGTDLEGRTLSVKLDQYA